MRTTFEPVTKYDKDHDVLHIYNNERCNDYDSSAVEIEDGVYRIVDDETGAINGYKILDYKKKKRDVNGYDKENCPLLSDSEGDIGYEHPSKV